MDTTACWRVSRRGSWEFELDVKDFGLNASGPVWLVSKNYPIQYLDLEVSSSPAVRKTANPNLPLEAWRPQLRHFLQKRRWKLQSRMIVGRSQLQFSIIANRHFWTKPLVTFGRNCSLQDLDILGRFHVHQRVHDLPVFGLEKRGWSTCLQQFQGFWNPFFPNPFLFERLFSPTRRSQVSR